MTAVMMNVVEEAVEAALESCGWAWSRRDNAWAIAANARLPREIQVRRDDGAVVVSSVLVEADEPVGEALTRFLAQAQGDLTGVACTVEGAAARVSARVAVEQIDENLGRTIAVIGNAVRRLSRESAALLNADAAEAYLAFHQGKS